MGDSKIKFPDATNFEYAHPTKAKTIKKIFISYANSYHAKAIVSNILKLNNSQNVDDDDEIEYKIYGTMQHNNNLPTNLPNVEFLNSKCDDFLPRVTQCDVIICDISQDTCQLDETKAILDCLEAKLETASETKIQLILLSTIMTWAKTKQVDDEIVSDKDYRKRRPHSCFFEHIFLERRVMNLQKKFENFVKSVVICPGVIYGAEEDIFHYIFKKCYCNCPEVEIFLPAKNYLPLIYIFDFAKVILRFVEDSPEIESNYVLACQSGTLNALEICEIFLNNSDTRIRICEQNEIFNMRDDLITVSF